MRIAYISYEYPPDSSNGGIATYVAQAARMMTRRGHEVEVFASSSSRHGRFVKNEIVEHWIQETHRGNFGVIAGHVFAARHAEKPFDILEGPEFNADARKAVELVPSVPLVVKMHTPTLKIVSLNSPSGFAPHFRNVVRQLRGLAAYALKGRPLQPLSFTLPAIQAARRMEQIEMNHARRAAVVAPPCLELCEYAKSVWKIPDEAVRFAPHPYVPAHEILALQPCSERATVGFVGRLERRKGIEVLAAAIPVVLEAVPEARFRFVGAPEAHPSGVPYEAWIRRRMPRHRARLEFAGKYPLERMAEAYNSMDVCVLPSLWENFPNVCLEAMSAACGESPVPPVAWPRCWTTDAWAGSLLPVIQGRWPARSSPCFGRLRRGFGSVSWPGSGCWKLTTKTSLGP